MNNIRDIALIKNSDPILQSKIVLYGGGTMGLRAATMLRRAGISVGAVCTSSKEGKCLIKKIPHINVSQLKEMDDREDLLIVIATIVNEFMEQILETLNGHRIFRGQRVTYLGLAYACVLNRQIDKDGRLACERKLWYRYKEYEGWTAKHWSLWAMLSGNVVWVYGSEKVGGSTLRASLEKCNVPNVHIHEVEKERLKRSWLRRLDGRGMVLARPLEDYDNILKHLKEGRSIRIITAIREPIARDISLFFQGFQVPYSEWVDQTNDIYADFIKMTQYYLKSNDMFEWFNKELKVVFGVDVYAYPFDQEKGYAVIEKENISVLVLKLEKMNSLLSVIKQFVRAKNFDLVKANEARNKPYRYMYEEFKENVKLPQNYVDRYYHDNPYMDHFYSQKEKADFLEQWRANIW